MLFFPAAFSDFKHKSIGMWIFVSIKSLVTSSNCISNQQKQCKRNDMHQQRKTYRANFKRMKETPFNCIAPVSSVAIHTTKNYFRGFHNHCFSYFFFSFGIVWQTAFTKFGICTSIKLDETKIIVNSQLVFAI